MFLFFCDCLFQTEIRVLKRPVLVFFLFERNAVLHFFLKMVLGFRHENSTARLSCSLWPVVHSKFDFCLVISNGSFCLTPVPCRKRCEKIVEYSCDIRQIQTLCCIFFWFILRQLLTLLVPSTRPVEFSVNLARLLLFFSFCSGQKLSVFDVC